VSRAASGPDLAARLGIEAPDALIMLVGGAGALSLDEFARVGTLMQDGVARAAAQTRAVVVDGGTQSGVMQLIGEGLAFIGPTAPLIGVAPEGVVAYPGGPGPDDGHTPLEPHHSHFVLVEGDQFGDETEVMYRLAEALSARCPSVAVLVNGGQIAAREVEWNVRQKREIVVLAGSGRLADALAEVALRGREPADPAVGEIARRGRLTFFDVTQPATELAGWLTRKLKS
jgi:hypothetical protein